jgi:hypothetical protein
MEEDFLTDNRPFPQRWEEMTEIGMCLAPTYASEKILQNSFRPKISSNITAIFFNWDYG